MKRPQIFALALSLIAPHLHAAQVTNQIDGFTTFQNLSAENYAATNTVSSAGAIGGYRTITLLSTGNDEGSPTILAVSSNNSRLTLNTPEGPVPFFQILWGGADGTNGLGGIDFGAGQPLDLSTSALNFSLRSTDQASNFAWEFTDTLSNTATYNGTFPVHSSTNAPLPVGIALSSFANAGSVNWNSINYIRLSGGGVAGLDMSIPAPLSVIASTVPEPRTYALLAVGLGLTAFATFRRRTRHRI